MSSATPGDLRREHAEVVPGHDVRATGARVRLDRLAVGEDQDHEQRDDAERERHQRTERQRAGTTDEQHREHLFGRVRHRGERVAGEHRERGAVPEAFVDLLVGADLAPEHHVDEVRATGAAHPHELDGGFVAVVGARLDGRRRCGI